MYCHCFILCKNLVTSLMMVPFFQTHNSIASFFMLARFVLFTTEEFVIPEIKTSSNNSYYFEAGDAHAEVPGEQLGKHFSESDAFTFFIDFGKNLSISLLANFLYDMIKSKKVSRIKLNGNSLGNTQDEIQKSIASLQDDEKDNKGVSS